MPLQSASGTTRSFDWGAAGINPPHLQAPRGHGVGRVWAALAASAWPLERLLFNHGAYLLWEGGRRPPGSHRNLRRCAGRPRAWTAVTRRRGRPHPDRRALSTDYSLRWPAVQVVRRAPPVHGRAQRGAGTHSPTPAAVAVRVVVETLTDPDRSTGTRPPPQGLHTCGCLQRLLFTDRRTAAVSWRILPPAGSPSTFIIVIAHGRRRLHGTPLVRKGGGVCRGRRGQHLGRVAVGRRHRRDRGVAARRDVEVGNPTAAANLLHARRP